MVLLILDMVGDPNEIDLARQALTTAVASAPEKTYFGVMKAQDGLTVLLDPTSEREAVTKTIDTYPVNGTPGLLETVETATDLTENVLKKAPVRIAILYVTDSDIYDYREDFTNPVINWSDRSDLSRRFPEGMVRERISKLDAKLNTRQTPIFVVHLEYENDQLNEAYQNGLMQLASTTGGDTVFCRSNTEIATAIEAMMGKIYSHYGLDLQVPAGAAEMVDISVEAPDAQLTHRARYDLKR
jgi:hypothetical protein